MIELIPGIYTDKDKLKITKIKNITFTGKILQFQVEFLNSEIVSMRPDPDILRLTITNSTYFMTSEGN